MAGFCVKKYSPPYPPIRPMKNKKILRRRVPRTMDPGCGPAALFRIEREGCLDFETEVEQVFALGLAGGGALDFVE